MPLVSSIEGKNFHLCGPMRWRRDYPTEPGFSRIADELVARGAGYVYNPFLSGLGGGGLETQTQRLDNYRNLTRVSVAEDGSGIGPVVDFLVLMPGWEFSYGARIEREIAISCGIGVVKLDDLFAEQPRCDIPDVLNDLKIDSNGGTAGRERGSQASICDINALYRSGELRLPGREPEPDALAV